MRAALDLADCFRSHVSCDDFDVVPFGAGNRSMIKPALKMLTAYTRYEADEVTIVCRTVKSMCGHPLNTLTAPTQ